MNETRRLQKETRSLFRELSRGKRLYVFIRSLSCPFEGIAGFIPAAGRVLDLGCGSGFFDFYLKKKYPALHITAVDSKKDRVDDASAIADRYGFRELIFCRADILTWRFEDSYDCIVFNDVLYQFSRDERKMILGKAALCLNRGGGIIIKETARRPRLKYWFCFFQERFVARVLGLNERLVNIPSREEIDALSRDLGLTARNYALDTGYPYPHVLYHLVENDDKDTSC